MLSMTEENKAKLGISLYRILSRANFYLPFLIIYLIQLNLSIIQVEFLMAVYGISSLIWLMYLKKAFFNNFSDKSLLIISESFKIVGLITLILFNQFPLLLLAQFFLGSSYAIGAGSDSSIINSDILNDPNFQSKSNSYMFNTLLISGLIGSVLFNINNKLPLVATAIASAICILIITIFLSKNSFYTPDSIDTSKKVKEPLSNNIKSVMTEYIGLRGIILTLFMGFLPYHLFFDLKVSIYVFIIILTSYTLSGSISSKYLTKYLNFNKINLILLGSLILMLVNNTICLIIGTILLGIASGPTRPITQKILKSNPNFQKINKLMESDYALLNATLLIVGGFIYSAYSFNYIIVMFLIVYTAMIIIEKTLRRNHEH